MRVRVVSVAVGVLTTGVLLVGAGTSMAKALPKIRPFEPAHSGELLPLHGGTVQSGNWSGYAVTPSADNVTGVDSSFVVPTASLLIPGFAATWDGIGGYTGSDLIQAGVSENSPETGLIEGGDYNAWYEILPASETEISNCTGDASCTVSAGDQMTVDIQLVSGDTWNIAITDVGKWNWDQDINYASSESSAEWILEAPTVGAQTILADVGTASFGSDDTYTTSDGVTHTIAAGDPTEIELSPEGIGVIEEATPSALAADGKSFNDCSYTLSTCAAP
jgi:peptidase A4-like protein